MSSTIEKISSVLKTAIPDEAFKEIEPHLAELNDFLEAVQDFPIIKYISKIHSVSSDVLNPPTKKIYIERLKVLTGDLGMKMFDISVLEPYLDSKKNRQGELIAPSSKCQYVSALIHNAPAEHGTMLEQLCAKYKNEANSEDEMARKMGAVVKLQQKYSHITLKDFCRKIVEGCRAIRLYAREHPEKITKKNNSIRCPEFPGYYFDLRMIYCIEIINLLYLHTENVKRADFRNIAILEKIPTDDDGLLDKWENGEQRPFYYENGYISTDYGWLKDRKGLKKAEKTLDYTVIKNEIDDFIKATSRDDDYWLFGCLQDGAQFTTKLTRFNNILMGNKVPKKRNAKGKLVEDTTAMDSLGPMFYRHKHGFETSAADRASNKTAVECGHSTATRQKHYTQPEVIESSFPKDIEPHVTRREKRQLETEEFARKRAALCEVTNVDA